MVLVESLWVAGDNIHGSAIHFYLYVQDVIYTHMEVLFASTATNLDTT